MLKKHLISILLVSIIVPNTAQATVIGGDVTGGSAKAAGGVFEIMNPTPSQVGNNNQQSNNLSAFNEDQNINILAPISVNTGSNPQAGDIVASHYIIFDPVSTKRVIGYIDFDADVFGIISSTANLANSDFLINNSVTYNSPSLRGLEAGDTAWIDGSLANRVHVDFTASTPGDYIRVLTMRSPLADIPEPSMVGLIGLGLWGLAFLRRRKA